MKPALSPRDLARAIGVSESSVKRWVDNGVITAMKTAGGHRRIAVSEAVRFIRESSSSLVQPTALGLSDAAGLHPAGLAPDEETALLYGYLRAGEAEAARELVVSLYLSGRTVAQLVDGPLRAAMEQIGELWRHEEPGIFREHRATDIVISAVNRLRSLLPSPGDRAPVAVGGAPAGDPYFLPSLCAAAVLQSQGLNAVNLGPDTPMTSLLLAWESLRAQLIWLSVSVFESPASLAAELRRLVSAVRERGVPVIVGGARAREFHLPDEPLLHVGSSMAELEAMVKGLRGAAAGWA